MRVLLFVAAVLLLLAGHLLRCWRHALLLPREAAGSRFDLLLALTLGNVVNVLVPFHAGDVARTAFIAVRYRVRLSAAAASIVAERLSDIAVVLVLVATLAWLDRAAAARFAAIAARIGCVGLVVVVMSLLVSSSPRARRALWTAASAFNDAIRIEIVDFAWKTAEAVMCPALYLRKAYFVASAGMWSLYLGAYTCFALAVQTSRADVTLALLGEPGSPLVLQALGMRSAGHMFALVSFACAPLGAVLALGVIRRSGVWRSVVAVRRYGFEALGVLGAVPRDRFPDPVQYAAFLESHFTGRNEMVARLATHAAPGVVVRKLLPGGSDAITAVVETGAGELRVRKLASGRGAEKLCAQARWMADHRNCLPLAHIVATSRAGSLFCYDMPLINGARDFYEVVHTSPVARSSEILLDVVENMSRFHADKSYADASELVVDRYIEEKVLRNAEQILDYAAAFFPAGAYKVNGIEHHLSEWDVLRDRAWSRRQVRSRRACVVHGDLTIENIVVAPSTTRGWYLIDPNPDNVFNTPLIDWAKLMQSLDLGYEALNRDGHAMTVAGNELTILFSRSTVYGKLHSRLLGTLSRWLTPEELREVAFHEIVNLLRLTPYKIRNQPQRALTFFACTSVLLRRYLGGAVAAPEGHRWHA